MQSSQGLNLMGGGGEIDFEHELHHQFQDPLILSTSASDDTGIPAEMHGHQHTVISNTSASRELSPDFCAKLLEELHSTQAQATTSPSNPLQQSPSASQGNQSEDFSGLLSAGTEATDFEDLLRSQESLGGLPAFERARTMTSSSVESELLETDEDIMQLLSPLGTSRHASMNPTIPCDGLSAFSHDDHHLLQQQEQQPSPELSNIQSPNPKTVAGSATVRYANRQYHVNDYISIYGLDGNEYYGIITSFYTIHDLLQRQSQIQHLLARSIGLISGKTQGDVTDLFFLMRWLSPDRGRFQKAVAEGRDLLPTDFQEETLLQFVKSSPASSTARRQISAINTSQLPPLPGHKPCLVVNESSQEMLKLKRLAANEAVPTDDFVKMVSLMLISHVNLFLTSFGDSFTNWISWMLDEDPDRFIKYAAQLSSTESTALVKELRSVLKSVDKKTLPMLAAHFDKLLMTHFVQLQQLPGQQYGWCPIPATLQATNKYPFNLVQMTRAAHLMPVISERVANIYGIDTQRALTAPEAFLVLTEITAGLNEHHHQQQKSTSDAQPEMSEYLNFLSSVASQTRTRHTSGGDVAAAVPYERLTVGSLVGDTNWASIYTVRFQVKPASAYGNLKHQKLIDRIGNTMMELLTARFILKLMGDYMTTVLYQTIDTPEEGLNPKEKVVRFVETKIAEEIQARQRNESAESSSVEEAIARVAALDPRFTVWSHPVDVHYTTKSIAGWPKLVLQVYHQDMFGRNELYGYGFMHIPTTPGNHVVECVTWRPSGTMMDQIWAYFLGATPQLKSLDLVHNPTDRFRLQTMAMGKVHVELNIVVRNFEKYGVSL
ncbi:B9 domain-containing protein 2 [Chytridiales sp. JEL 0842]|nr:B9 domain-containing protein 2 [Chytridiales sp. JEL 0842]